jgi:bifunctional non-homologous end joining protein LigD
MAVRKSRRDIAKDAARAAKGTARPAKDVARPAKDTARAAKDAARAAKDTSRPAKDTSRAPKDTARPAKGTSRAAEDTAQLRGYRAKRDFAATPEPQPAPPSASASGPARSRRSRARDDSAAAERGPRFVIHEHDASRLHWDLRLEREGALACWALPKGLPEAPGENHFAAHTEDHPLEYLDFHGEIPKGNYGAGAMGIWDEGTYECLKWEPRKVEVALHGRRVDARYALFPIEAGEQPKDWMIHRMDPPADPHREPMPARIVPMMARNGELPAEEGGWAHEIKWDGVRAIAYCRPGELRLESRNLNDVTASYPDLSRLGRALGAHSAVLDGEIVAFDAGRPSFAALQTRMHVSSASQAKRLAAATPVTYMIFDLLWLDGHSLMAFAYAQRRELLAALALNGERWQTPEHVVGEGAALLSATAEQGLEGIVAKRLDSTYEPGVRSPAWVKIKRVGRQEFVVGGWMPGKGKREHSIGALLLGVYEGEDLRYVGRVGSGFGERELERLTGLLEPLARRDSPFSAGERPPREARYCEPRLVAEVEFAHWTEGGNLRAAVYKGLREDRSPQDVVREGTPPQTPQAQARDGTAAERSEAISINERSATKADTTVAGRELVLSNLDKTMYGKGGRRFSKRDLIDYYAAIAPALLPHLEGRALTVVRWPDGVEGKSFFQKQAPAHRPEWVATATIPAGAKQIDYTLANDLATLVWLANLAAIELHVPLARADAIERPTALVFDLDPGAPASIVECCHVALALHGMFENLGLESFAKTSGSKGLQVYLPLNRPEASFAQTKPFAKAVAELLEEAEGEVIVSRMTKARREGKVLIDWSQNDRNKTTVCAYSLRAAPRPTVSTPVAWEEVKATLDSGDPRSLSFESDAVRERVNEMGDLFAPVLSLVQELPKV